MQIRERITAYTEIIAFGNEVRYWPLSDRSLRSLSMLGYNVPAGESDKLARIWVELFLSSAQVFLQRQLPQPYGATLMKSIGHYFLCRATGETGRSSARSGRTHSGFRNEDTAVMTSQDTSMDALHPNREGPESKATSMPRAGQNISCGFGSALHLWSECPSSWRQRSE